MRQSSSAQQQVFRIGQGMQPANHPDFLRSECTVPALFPVGTLSRWNVGIGTCINTNMFQATSVGARGTEDTATPTSGIPADIMSVYSAMYGWHYEVPAVPVRLYLRVRKCGGPVL